MSCISKNSVLVFDKNAVLTGADANAVGNEKILVFPAACADTDTHVMTVHEGMLSASQMEMILAELGAEL